MSTDNAPSPEDYLRDRLDRVSRALRRLLDAVQDRFPGIEDPRVESSSLSVAWHEARRELAGGGAPDPEPPPPDLS